MSYKLIANKQIYIKKLEAINNFITIFYKAAIILGYKTNNIGTKSLLKQNFTILKHFKIALKRNLINNVVGLKTKLLLQVLEKQITSNNCALYLVINEKIPKEISQEKEK